MLSPALTEPNDMRKVFSWVTRSRFHYAIPRQKADGLSGISNRGGIALDRECVDYALSSHRAVRAMNHAPYYLT
jgi:hypothetical protein